MKSEYATVLMSPNKQILEDCIDSLNNLPGIKAVLRGKTSVPQITLISPLNTVQYHYETKNLSTNTVGLVISQLQRLGDTSADRPLLFTRQVPDRLIDQMIEHGLEFVDAAGNLYLNSPAAYALIRGKRLPKVAAAATKTFTTNGFKLIYVILQDPDQLTANHRAIASAAGIAASSVGLILKQLESMQYLQRKRNGNYQLFDYAKLLHRWELGYVERLRPKLFVGQFSPANGESIAALTQSLSQQAEKQGFLIGGELGAAIATNYLRPQSVTLHVQENYRPLLVKLRLKPDPQGSITLLQQFGTANGNQSPGAEILADPRLIYAELMMTGNDRLRETADRLLENIIAPDLTHA
jgi:hypothetical protein